MKGYKISAPAYHQENADEATPAMVQWAGSQVDARHMRMALEVPMMYIKPAKRPRVTVEEIEIPTDKTGLLVFLNSLSES